VAVHIGVPVLAQKPGMAEPSEPMQRSLMKEQPRLRPHMSGSVTE
jgi:hypothetical protein